MKSKIIAIALFAVTAATVINFPAIRAKPFVGGQSVESTPAVSAPRIDVVFVLDTTGSMGGLLQTAKEKIWSIATTMASAQPTPEIRIGLVGFRDRGDEYVTRVVDLSDDLDSVYAALMDFQASGGGDGPEDVNKALYDAVHGVSWSQRDNAYRVVFLVGDAPPHMDYQSEAQYPAILAAARERGIVVNTIQCGTVSATTRPWQQIAALGAGRYFQVEQAGSAVAYTTPFDTKIAELAARLDDTRLYFGSDEEKKRMASKLRATEKLNKDASVESRARRGAFNASAAGEANLLGDNELIDAVSSGRVALDEIDAAALPETLKPLPRAEQKAVIAEMAGERNDLRRQIRELAASRAHYLDKKVEEAGGARESLDQKLFETVSEQAAAVGLEYRDGPDY